MHSKVKRKVNSPIKHPSSVEVKASLHVCTSSVKWMQAAEDARLKIASFKKKIRCLEETVQTCEEFARTGERWPGDNKKGPQEGGQ